MGKIETAPTPEEMMEFIRMVRWKTSRQYAMNNTKEDVCRRLHWQAHGFLQRGSDSHLNASIAKAEGKDVA